METVDPEALLLPVHSIVVCRSCEVSAVADAPTTILADGPPPLTGRTLGPSLSPVQYCGQMSHGTASGSVIGNAALVDTYPKE